MTKRNLVGKISVCAVMLVLVSPAWAAAPSDGTPPGWLAQLYACMLEWWDLEGSTGPNVVNAGSELGGGELATMDSGPADDPGSLDPRTERGVAGDPNG